MSQIQIHLISQPYPTMNIFKTQSIVPVLKQVRFEVVGTKRNRLLYHFKTFKQEAKAKWNCFSKALSTKSHEMLDKIKSVKVSIIIIRFGECLSHSTTSGYFPISLFFPPSHNNISQFCSDKQQIPKPSFPKVSLSTVSLSKFKAPKLCLVRRSTKHDETAIPKLTLRKPRHVKAGAQSHEAMMDRLVCLVAPYDYAVFYVSCLFVVSFVLEYLY